MGCAWTIPKPPLPRSMEILSSMKPVPGARKAGDHCPKAMRDVVAASVTSPFLYWTKKTPWMEEPGRLQSMGRQRVGHDSNFAFTFKDWLDDAWSYWLKHWCSPIRAYKEVLTITEVTHTAQASPNSFYFWPGKGQPGTAGGPQTFLVPLMFGNSNLNALPSCIFYGF